MRKHRSTYVALLLSTFVVGQLGGSLGAGTVQAAGSSPASAVTTSAANFVRPVTMGPGITATLEDVNLWTQPSGNILTYTLNYSNGSGSSANLLHYFSRVVTPGGSVIPGNPVTADALKKKVGAKENLRVTYYVNVGQTKSFKGIKISMYVWDAKTKGYLKQTGSFPIPSNYSTTVANGKSLNTTLSDIPVTAMAESLQLFKYGGKVYAKIGISMTNKGNKVLTDPGYKAYLVSASGTSFELALNSSQSSYKIQPQERKSIYYLTEIPPYLKTDNMKLQFTQKDDTLKLELPKSTFSLPAAITPNLVVGNGVVKKISINSNTIETLLSNTSVFADKGAATWSFQLQLKNSGNKAVTLPTYELAIKTAKGVTFPVNAKALSGITLKPLEVKVIPLTVQVPLEVEQNTLQLQMIEAVSPGAAGESGTPGTTATNGTAGTTGGDVEAAKISFPIAYFTIPYALRADIQKGQEYRTTNAFGSFSYSLQSLQRYPWKDDDIVAAKLKITNTQSVALTLPELKGALTLDIDDVTPSTELLMDKDALTLAPGKSADIYVLGKIPYTQEFEKIKINLFTSVNNENTPFLDISAINNLNTIETIQRGGSYSLIGKGKNATVQENRTTVYEGTNFNILYTELLLSSEEKRQSKMARLQAYYRTADGQFFEATANQTDIPATPGGKQLITFWSKLPKTANIGDISLYLGPGISGNKLSETGQEASGFIDIASLLLAPQTAVPATNLSKISLYPYTLNILNTDGRHLEGTDSINIAITYNLSRDNSYDSGVLDHKLVLKVIDPFGFSQEKVLALGTELSEGTNNSYSVSFSRNLYKQLVGGTYKITLYDEFQGERQELGSQAYVLGIDLLPKTEK